MGLDMYLYGEVFLSGFHDEGRELKMKIADMLGIGYRKTTWNSGEPKIEWDDVEVNGIELEVGYWRKSNAIHQWFVDNVQDGVDDCGRYYVGRDKLEQLRQDCLDVLHDHSLADKLLPTSSGFFFGSTEYSQYYFKDLQKTVDIIDRAIELYEDEDSPMRFISFYYRSSW